MRLLQRRKRGILGEVSERGTGLFLDSGAHSLYTREVINKGHTRGYEFFETDAFWEYVDSYANFVKANKDLFDVYVTVDVIFNPDLTWKVYKYLKEEHKLSPLPVVHFGTDLKWLKKYMDECDYIGLGGLGQEVLSTQYVAWGDLVFSMLCDFPDRLPRWKTHGFAVTSFKLMRRYPWYSVDSNSYCIYASLGVVLVPFFKEGRWVYEEDPMKVVVTPPSPFRSKPRGGERLYLDLYPSEVRDVILKYFDEKGYNLGKTRFKRVKTPYTLKENEVFCGKEKDGMREVIVKEELGLSNDSSLREELNIIYYLNFGRSLPSWPWPFKCGRKSLDQ